MLNAEKIIRLKKRDMAEEYEISDEHRRKKSCLVNYERKREYLGRGVQKMYEIFIKKYERSFCSLVEISKRLWYTVF